MTARNYPFISKPSLMPDVDVDGQLIDLETPLEDAQSIRDRSVDCQWLVENLLPEKTLTVISAKRGSMKTFFAYGLAVAVASGVPFLGRDTKRRHVIYCDNDNPEVVIHKRLNMMGSPEGFHLWCGKLPEHKKNPPPPIDSAKGQLKYSRLIERFQPNPLLIFDTFSQFYSPGRRPNKDEDMRPVITAYNKLVALGCTILYLHHCSITSEAGKPVRAFKGKGSTVIEDDPDNAYILHPGAHKGDIYMYCEKNRLDFVPTRKLHMMEDFHFGGYTWDDVSEGTED